jgi:hypothetical protein
MPARERDEILDPELESAEPRPTLRGELARQLRPQSAGPERVRVLIGAYAGRR